MLTKDFHVRTGSQYGVRVADQEEEKKKVASAVVDRILWPEGQTPKNPVFFSDGSSASFVWCYYLRKWVKLGPADDGLRVYTNNVDLPMQVLCEKGASQVVSVHSAPGRFNFKYCGNFGHETKPWIQEHCTGATCIMAVTALDAQLGPCAFGEDAKSIKEAVMKSANVLVIVADRSKIRKKRDISHAASPDCWLEWRDEKSKDGRLFVVTTHSPGFGPLFRAFPAKGANDERSPDEIENDNLWVLSHKLGKHQLILV